MVISITHKRKAIRIGALLAALLLIAGCGGIKPYDPPNNREEGPEEGLFTGSQGEWVILGPKAHQTDAEEKKNEPQEAETEGEEKKGPQTPADGEQQ
jgi:hypothetical protein